MPIDAPDERASASPDWVSDSKIVQEGLAYIDTFRSVVNGPRTFAREWAAGRKPAMNPLTFFAISLGMSAALGEVLRQTYAIQPQATSPARTVAAYVAAGYTAFFLHFVAYRKDRLPFRTTVGATLYGYASLYLFGRYALSGLLYLLTFTLGKDPTRGRNFLAGLGVVWLVIALSWVVSGAHERNVWACIAWVILAWLALVLVSSVVLFALGIEQGAFG